MNISEEREKQLGEEFPLLFADKNFYDKPIALVFGGIPVGWFDFVYSLCNKLESIIEAMPEIERSSFFAKQVKEKFGGLRFYTTFPFESEAGKLIQEAEARSFRICEICGIEDETVKTGGYSWIRTLCITHREEVLKNLLKESITESYEQYQAGREPNEFNIHKLDYVSKMLRELNVQRKTGKH